MSATDTSAAAVKHNNTSRESLLDDLAILDAHAESVLRELQERLDDQARRGLRALALAPTLDLYRALMRGEHVPLDLLNADAVARYGIKR